MQFQNKDIRLVYVDTPGRAEVARLCFHLGNIKFIDERQSYDKFGVDKANGRFKFGQVPVLYVNGKQYVQSRAIYQYAAQLAGLYPSNPLDTLVVEQALSTVAELHETLIQAVYYQKLSEEQFKQLNEGKVRTLFNYLVNLIQENQTGFFVGNKLTLPDIHLYVLTQMIYSGQLPGIDQQYINQFPEMVRLHKIISLKSEVVAFEKKYNNR